MERCGLPFDFNQHRTGSILDKAAQIQLASQSVNERPETDRLHQAVDSNRSPLHHAVADQLIK
jgi:hypothetical protein